MSSLPVVNLRMWCILYEGFLLVFLGQAFKTTFLNLQLIAEKRIGSTLIIPALQIHTYLFAIRHNPLSH